MIRKPIYLSLSSYVPFLKVIPVQSSFWFLSYLLSFLSPAPFLKVVADQLSLPFLYYYFSFKFPFQEKLVSFHFLLKCCLVELEGKLAESLDS